VTPIPDPRRLASIPRIAAVALWLAPAASLAAQPPAKPAAPGVTVSGVTVTPARPTPAPQVLRHEAFAFTRSHGEPARAGHIPRWIDAVCPVTLGLPPNFATFISARVRALAASVGARAGGAGCRPNVEIVFADDPQAVVDRIADQRPALLGFHYAAQRKRLASFQGPVEAWYATATDTRDGQQFPDLPQEQMPANPSGSSFTSVLIVLDGKRMAGYPVGQAADAIGMLALNMVRPPFRCSPLPSILNLAAAGCGEAPVTITDADRAFLKALYRVETGQRLAWARGDIALRVAHEITPRP
jgi:hypothetical protein